MQNVQTTSPGEAVGAEGFPRWFAQMRRRVDEALAAHFRGLEDASGANSRLPEAVRYSVEVGGKRLRPILILESCRVCGGRPEAALAPALAIELIHTFSLIHDDLPAMDNDDLRRGKPTNHKVFGEAQAILAGDWLVTQAFALLAAGGCERRALPILVHTLAEGTKRMIEGQAADIEGEGRPPDGELVRYIHRNKTAALIETCCRLGATCAKASDEVVDALARYGNHLGIAFQIADDRLDAVGSEELMGKRVGKDAVVAKQTYPAAFGLDASESHALREVNAALAALEPFGGQADRLRQLARYVISRQN